MVTDSDADAGDPRHADRRTVQEVGTEDSADEESQLRRRYGALRRTAIPPRLAIIALAVLIALASPATRMRLATSDASTYGSTDTARIAYDLLKEGFGRWLQRAASARGRAADGQRSQAPLEKSRSAYEATGSPAVRAAILNEASDTATMIAGDAERPRRRTRPPTRRSSTVAGCHASAGLHRRPARASRSAARPPQPRLLGDDPSKLPLSSASSSGCRCCCW